MNDEKLKQLHDRSTRGEVLSGEEQARLSDWYGQQDNEELATLARGSGSSSLAALRAQVDDAVAQLSAASERIQLLNAENERTRREIAALERQLAQKATA